MKQFRETRYQLPDERVIAAAREFAEERVNFRVGRPTPITQEHQTNWDYRGVCSEAECCAVQKLAAQ